MDTITNDLIFTDPQPEDMRNTSLDDYLAHLRQVVANDGYDAPECSLNLPSDQTILEAVRATINKIRGGDLTHVFVIGIGGSNLGAWAVYDAIRGPLANHRASNHPKLYFLDTISPKLLAAAIEIVKAEQLKPEQILINVVTKSGTTTETIANFEIFRAALTHTMGDINDRIIITTDEGSKLWQIAATQNLSRLAIPKLVGGRYSIFSASGLLPLALAGINIEQLVAGAVAMRDRCLAAKSPAQQSAERIFASHRAGAVIHDTFFFNPELEMVGKWYRQLMAESLGKEKDVAGRVVHAGITPTVSIGSTDLHSMAQLYFGGPRQRFTTFVYAPQAELAQVPNESQAAELVGGIAGRDAAEIMTAIYRGTVATYRNRHLPYTEIKLAAINEYAIGQFLQLKMIEIMLLAQLLDVNAFGQPNVEEYKAETRRILEGAS